MQLSGPCLGTFRNGPLGANRALDAMAVPFSSQALMEDAVKTPNVVEATNKPGLYDKLEDLKKRWAPYLSRRGASLWWKPKSCTSPPTPLARPGNPQVVG